MVDKTREYQLEAKLMIFLRRFDVWYADGTFKMAPPLFYQVYVFMARRHGGVFLWCIAALLSNKFE